jgi:carboxypeptidase Q
VRPRSLVLGAALGAAAVLAICAQTPPPAASSIPAETRAALEELMARGTASTGAYDTLRTLTDGVGPRLAGSPGDAAAVAWGLATMKSLGFVNVRAEPVTVPHWRRGDEVGELLSPAPQRLILTALGGSVPTPQGGVEADVVEAESLEGVDALGERAKGKIVLVWKRTRRARDGAGYGETVPIRSQGPSRAAKLGAVGLLIRSVSTADTRLPHTGVTIYDEKVPKIPAAALATPDADMLHRLLATGAHVRVRFTLTCATLPDARSANVVGEVPGREKPDEVVVIGGHLDSWDLGSGAVDDGAGCAVMLDAARLIAASKRRPARTVRIVLFANEENGARGAAAYSQAHAAEMPRHAAAMEADSGAGRAFGFSWNAGAAAEPVLTDVASILSRIGSGETRKRGDGGVDVSPMRRFGVPLVGVFQDASGYFDIHHSADDTLDKVDPATLQNAATTAAVLAYALADLPMLPRIPEAERTPTTH